MKIETIWGNDAEINCEPVFSNWITNFTESSDGKFRFIYCTKNLVNGKIYVGQHTTSNLDDGYLGSGKILHEAIKKYGKENFKTRHCCYCDNKEDLDKAEIYWIAYWEAVKNGYNICKGGGGVSGIKAWNKGLKMTEEQKQKLRKPKSEEHKRKLSLQRKGKPLSQEHREKIGLSQKGDKNGFWGKKHSEESLKKISLSRIGKPPYNKGKSMSIEQKLKLSSAMKGRVSPNKGKKMTDEQKLKLSEKNKGRKLTQEVKNKIAIYALNNPLTTEQKLNLSLKLKGYVHKIVICPHCNKSGGMPSMKRWRFDNCKHKH